MSNIIEKLYFGNLIPKEDICNSIPKYISYQNKVLSSQQELHDFFKANQLYEKSETFDRLFDDYSAMQSIISLNRFEEGFRLGAEFAHEIFSSHDKRST